MPYDDAPDPGAFDLGYQEETINFQDSFKSEEEVTAPEYPPEGIYHVSLQSVDSSGKSYPGAVFLAFEILAGNIGGQQGKVLRFVVWPVRDDAKNPETAKKQWNKTVLRLMLALGLRKSGEFPRVTFNDEWWTSLEGRQCIVRVTHKVQKRKTESGKDVEWISAVIGDRNDLFPIGDEAVAGVPIDEQSAQLGGYLSPDVESADI